MCGMPQTCTIASADGQEFEISAKIVAMSGMLQHMVARSSKFPILIPGVRGHTLKRVVDFCRHHQDDEFYTPSLTSLKKSDEDPWDKKFLDIDSDSLIVLSNAAFQMNINRLVDATCYRWVHSKNGKGFTADNFSPEDAQAQLEEAPIFRYGNLAENSVIS